MTEKQRLEQRLWDIANTLRGKMGADDFRDYILGFIFYKRVLRKNPQTSIIPCFKRKNLYNGIMISINII